MQRKWLWVEDEENTAPDALVSVLHDSKNVIRFVNMDKLIEFLQGLSEAISKRELLLGFLLDVMVESSPAFLRPAMLSSTGEEEIFLTNRGFDAGLVFYEEVILAEAISSQGLFFPPPPVLFLTVRHTDRLDILARLDKIKKSWARAHGVPLNEAHVQWIRKSEAAVGEIKRILQMW